MPCCVEVNSFSYNIRERHINFIATSLHSFLTAVATESFVCIQTENELKAFDFLYKHVDMLTPSIVSNKCCHRCQCSGHDLTVYKNPNNGEGKIGVIRKSYVLHEMHFAYTKDLNVHYIQRNSGT